MSKEAARFQTNLHGILTSFNTAVNKLIKEIDPLVIFSGVNASSILFDEKSVLMAYFSDLPNGIRNTKRASVNRTENIFLTGLLSGEINRDKRVYLNYYGTEVCYARKKNINNPIDLKPVAGFHYDFDEDKLVNHPIFHVQQNSGAGKRIFTTDLASKCSFYNFSFTCNFDCDSEEVRSIRIPTPQMDIFSAIIMMLADYVVHPSNHQQEFLSFLKHINQVLPCFKFETLPHISSGFKNNTNMSEWYPIS